MPAAITPRRLSWIEVGCIGVALFVFASTWNQGRWGEHWVFIVAYGLALVYCVVHRVWCGILAAAALLLLRYDLMERRGGWELRLGSTLFVVGFLLMCARLSQYQEESR